MNIGDKVKVEFEGVLRHKDAPGRVLFVADLKYGESYAVRPDMVRPQVSVTAHTPPKFKVGQKVRILDGRHDAIPLWYNSMTPLIGKVGVVCKVEDGLTDVRVGDVRFTYHNQWIERLKRGRPRGSTKKSVPDSPSIPALKVGDKVKILKWTRVPISEDPTWPGRVYTGMRGRVSEVGYDDVANNYCVDLRDSDENDEQVFHINWLKKVKQ